jgi:hypothetical protein
MPKTLLAIIFCKKYADRVKAIRDTWIPDAIAAGWDVQVFDGERLSVPDDYASLPLKTKALCQYAVDNGYDHLVKIDDDTYICVPFFQLIPFDYAGIRIPANNGGSNILRIPPCQYGKYPHDYASGGIYWLSRKAATIIAETPHNGDWAEDRFVGDTLARRGIKLTVIPQYIYVYPYTLSYYLKQGWTVLTQIPTPRDILACHNLPK